MSLPLLISALLDFERTPGRYPLIKRQPSLLFDQVHTVLLLAAGRAVEGLDAVGGDQPARRAARFFVRTALLRTGADHFTLLGLVPGASAGQVREHYRLMIRLTHPDFAGEGNPWPADAASRINIANDVLSSAQKRAGYEATLASAAAPRPNPTAMRRPAPVLKPVASNGTAPSRWDLWGSGRIRLVVASLGVLLCGGALVLLGPTGSGPSLAAHPEVPAVSPPPAMKLSEALEEVPDPASVSGDAVAKEVSTPEPALKRAAPATLARAAPATDPARPESVAAGAPAPTAATTEAEPMALTMRDVHPVLTQVINGLQSGDAAAMARAIDTGWRQTAANEAFVQQMGQWLAGHKVTQLDNLLFTAQTQGGALVVDGRVDVSSNDTTQQSRQRALHLRAVFKPQDGRPVLTQLAASQR